MRNMDRQTAETSFFMSIVSTFVLGLGGGLVLPDLIPGFSPGGTSLNLVFALIAGIIALIFGLVHLQRFESVLESLQGE